MNQVAVVLLLACLGVSSVAESGSFPYADGLGSYGDAEHAPLLYSTVAVCKAECTQLQQKSVLHDVHYDSTSPVIYLASAATALACALLGALLAVWRVSRLLGKEKAKYAAREAEARQREAGIKQQAAGLGEIAQEKAQQLLAKNQELENTRSELHNAKTQLQVARRHMHQLEQAHAQALAAPAMPGTENQTDDLDAAATHAPPALVGEASTPQLDDLVAGAAANDTSKCASDQFCTPASAKSVHSLKPSDPAALVELVANSRGTPVHSVVEMLNQRLKEEGLSERIQVQAVSSPSKAAPTTPPSAAKAAAEQHNVPACTTSPVVAAVPALSPPSLLPLPSPGVAAAASFSAQQQQQQVLPAVAVSPQQPSGTAGPAGGSFVTREELDSKLALITIERLQEKNNELVSENQLLKCERMAGMRSGSGLNTGYVNANRGSSTPLPFGSTGGMSVTPGWGKFTPGGSNTCQQFSAPRDAAAAAATATSVSNSASSSCFRGLPVPAPAPAPLPGTHTPAGSVGSTKQSPGQPVCTPDSATSCVSGRTAQVEPVPMQSLEAVGTPAGKPRSDVKQQPTSPELKSAAHKLSEVLDTAAAKSSKRRAEAQAKVAEVQQKVKPSPTP